ncbi:MAG: HD domain-containing protein [Ferruginibacter sp.]
MLTKEIYEIIRSGVLLNLANNLSKDLFYHCVDHTIDVEIQAERIAISEKILSGEDLLLLKTACLYHDTGFLFTYNEHEEAGCDLAVKELSAFGLTLKQVDIICGLIRATKIPQTPLSKLEEIICDADLDYLGREDFFPISNNLFLELKAANFISSENDWNLVQIKFFKQHQYFTATTKKLREQKKQEHLEMIEAMMQNV